MKDIVSEMLRHPIATVLIIATIGTATSGIIAAGKGVPCKPFVDINFIQK